jgi:hypothetical protein
VLPDWQTISFPVPPWAPHIFKIFRFLKNLIVDHHPPVPKYASGIKEDKSLPGDAFEKLLARSGKGGHAALQPLKRHAPDAKDQIREHTKFHAI